MSQTSKQDYTKIIRACAKANEYQLNIAVVGNVESGKSIFIDALTEYFRDGVECQARGRVMRNKRSAFEYLSNILVASLTTSLAETEKRVRLDNKSFDSV